MTAMSEQETTITQIRGGQFHVYTANPAHLRALRKRVAAGRATETRGDDETGFFVIPASEFDLMRGFRTKRKPMTPEQRAKSAERLKRARNSESTTQGS